MQLVLYNDQDKVLDVVKDIEDVKIDGDTIRWNSGSIGGMKANFALMPETIAVQNGDTLTTEQKSQAVNGDFRPIEKKIQEQVTNMQNVMNYMLFK